MTRGQPRAACTALHCRWTPDEITIVEAVLTLGQLGILLLNAWIIDVQPWKRVRSGCPPRGSMGFVQKQGFLGRGRRERRRPGAAACRAGHVYIVVWVSQPLRSVHTAGSSSFLRQRFSGRCASLLERGHSACCAVNVCLWGGGEGGG